MYTFILKARGGFDKVIRFPKIVPIVYVPIPLYSISGRYEEKRFVYESKDVVMGEKIAIYREI